MKTILFPSLIIISFAILSFTNPPDTIIGRWQQKFPDGNVATLVFRTDSTMDIFVNGKTFVSGNFLMKSDTLHLSDPTCNAAYFGTYTLNYFAKDSVRFVAARDTCMGRHQAMHQLRVGHLKPAGK